MNVEIGAEAALCPEKKYISGIFVAVQAIVLHILYARKWQLHFVCRHQGLIKQQNETW